MVCLFLPLNDVLATNPKCSLAHLWLARTYQERRMYAEAIHEYESTGALREWVPTVAGIGNVYGVWGKPEEARKMLGHLGEMAFAKLNEGVHERTHWLVWLNRDPRWKNLRSDPRFGESKKQVGLPN